jgi:hypothetical protein
LDFFVVRYATETIELETSFFALSSRVSMTRAPSMNSQTWFFSSSFNGCWRSLQQSES